MKLSEVSSIVPVRVAREGTFSSLGLARYQQPGLLVFMESERFLEHITSNPHVACVMTTEDLVDSLAAHLGVLISTYPRRDFYHLHNHLARHTTFYWEDFPTSVAPDAQISPHAYIAGENVRIGHRTIIEPGAVVLARTIIGDDVILRSGCVLSAQGFEFKRLREGILPVEHAGGVWLHDRVEIQANTAVDRSVFGGYTEIGEDTKIDNLVHIAHNVRIGKRCLIAASALVGGSVIMGDDVWVGPSATISSEIRVGDRAGISIGSVVTRDVEAEQTVSGNFAIDHEKFIAFIKSIR